MLLDELASHGLLLEEVCLKRLVSKGLSLKIVYLQEVISRTFLEGHDSTKPASQGLSLEGVFNDFPLKVCP